MKGDYYKLTSKQRHLSFKENARIENEQENPLKWCSQKDVNVTYFSWKLSQHWQMLPNQSLPSAQTKTEDRTVPYWTAMVSGSAKAAEGIDPSLDTLHYLKPNLCWLLFVSVVSPLQTNCFLALALYGVIMNACLGCMHGEGSD